MARLPLKAIRKALKRVNDAANQAFRPSPTLSVADWADEYRRLSTSSGAIGGRWRTSRVEVARGPMLAVTERGVRTITVMSCTQLMKTSLLENTIGRFAHLDPCPMLLTQPKEGAVKTFSKERIAPMAKATPVLGPLLGNDRQRGGSDTFDYKEFPGGFLAMESAGSPTNLAMRAIRITLADEIDKYETTKEGDPVLLLEERTSTFADNALHIRTCSPTWVETSRIFKSYNEGDQRQPFVACPHCGAETVLDFFDHVEWNKSPDGEHFPFTAAIYCKGCGGEWTETQRLNLMTTKGAIRWKQTRPFKCCEVFQEPLKTQKWEWDERYQVGYACCTECGERAVSNHHASFGHIGKLYSPFITVPELAAKWVLEKDDPETKQTFYNTQLGLPFEAQAMKKVDGHALSNRREKYQADVPMGGLVLTAGIDCQAGSEVTEGRLEVEVVAWGVGEESWSVDYQVFTGNPAQPEVWAKLDAYLLKAFKHESGHDMFIRGACIDSGGYNPEEAYKFARARMGRNVWAIKGASERGATWSPVWPIPKLEPRKTRLTGYRPVIIGVNAAKESIRQKLLVQEPGPGYAHFPAEYVETRFDQLTAESLVIERKAGVATRKWKKKHAGVANEALDCRVYAYAALCGLYAVRKLNLASLLGAIMRAVGATSEPEEDRTAATAAKLDGVLQNGNAAIMAEGSQPVKGRVALPGQAQPPANPRVHKSSFVG